MFSVDCYCGLGCVVVVVDTTQFWLLLHHHLRLFSLWPCLGAGKMPHGRFAASFDSPSVDVIVDLGNPILNYTLDGFIKVGGVGVAHAVLQDTFAILKKESVTKHDLNKIVKRAGREGFQAGLVAGVYAGVEYGIERARGKTDWKNAAIGGALTGALLSFSDGTFTRDKIIQHSITGGAIATASEFIRNIT
jgi:hypothetical protein